MTTLTVDTIREPRTRAPHVPLSRVVTVELRKMFDTRSGFWLMASIVITGVLTTVGMVAFAPDSELTYYTFAKAIGFPMTVVLPMIAILAITGEWSQRTGLTTFTLVPHRRRVVAAKTISSISVAVASMLFAFVLGAAGNVVGTAIAGTDMVWDVSVAEGFNIVLGSLLCLARPQPRHRRVERDAVDPGRQRRVAAEIVDLAIHLHQDVLRDLLGVFAILHLAERKLINA